MAGTATFCWFSIKHTFGCRKNEVEASSHPVWIQKYSQSVSRWSSQTRARPAPLETRPSHTGANALAMFSPSEGESCIFNLQADVP